MPKRDGEKDRAARARGLRERVDEIVRSREPPRKRESPREFVHRRMRETSGSDEEPTSGSGRASRRR